jgi:phosphoribosylformylglycinamidine synthase
LSEGGLAAGIAEMAFAGGIGAAIDLDAVPHSADARSPATLLFSESNTRFVVEVSEEHTAALEAALKDIPHARIGHTTPEARLTIDHNGSTVIESNLTALKEAWQSPLRW